MCPKGDDPLTLNQEHYYFTLRVWSAEPLTGTLGVDFQDEVSNFQLDGPTSRQCVAALEASGKFKQVACDLTQVSSLEYIYNMTVLEWPLSPKENNLYSHDGNPSSRDFHCDTSLVSVRASCEITTPDAGNFRGMLQVLLCANVFTLLAYFLLVQSMSTVRTVGCVILVLVCVVV